MNSLRSLGRAMEHEIERQIELLESGEPGRAGDAPLGRGRGRDPRHALEGGGVRLPLLPRARPRSRSRRPRRCAPRRGRRSRSCRRRAGRATRRSGGSAPTTPACSPRCPASTTYAEAAVAALTGGTAKDVVNWAIGDLLGLPQRAGDRARRAPALARRARRARRPRRRRHALTRAWPRTCSTSRLPSRKRPKAVVEERGPRAGERRR